MNIIKKHLFVFLLELAIFSLFIGTLFAPIYAQNASDTLLLTQEEQSWLDNHPEVSIIFTSDLPPSLMKAETGEYIGLLADYAKLFSEQTGINFNIKTRPSWTEVKASANNREADIIGIVATPDPIYNSLYHYTLPYVPSNFLIFGPTYSNIPGKDMKGLAGKRVGYLASYTIIENFTKSYPDIEFSTYQNADDIISAVERGKVDFIIHSDWFEYQLRIKQKKNIKAHLLIPGLNTKAFMLVRNDWPELSSIINKVISTNQEKIQKVIDKWLAFTKSIKVSGDTLQLTEEEQAWLTNHPTIQVGIDPLWAPIEFIGNDGIAQGISVQYLQRLQKILGVKFELVKSSPWLDSYNKLSRSELDLLPSVSATEERWEKVNFTAPYISTPIAIFSDVERAYLGGLEALTGKSVIIVEGHAIQAWLKRDYPKLKILTAPTLEEALKEVARGNAYAFVGNQVSASYYIGQSGLTQIKVVGHTDYSNDLSMAVRKDWGLLLGILQKALNTIPQNERDAIYYDWISIQYKHSMDYTILWQVLTGAFWILLITAYWIRRLAQEIAQRRQTEASLRLSKQKAEQATLEAQQATQAKSKFLANMSHEIRTPMNAVISANHLLGQTELTAVQSEYLNRMADSSNILLTTINDILGFSTGEAAQLKLDNVNFKLDIILNKVKHLFEPQATKKGLKLNVHIATSIPESLTGDGEKLSQILRNLTANAVKFTEQGKIEITINLIELSNNNSKARLSFTVKDTGPGINPDLQEKLFQPFTQGNHSVIGKYGGTGLGLAISQQLAQVMGSYIYTSSIQGKGSCFSFVVTFDVCDSQIQMKQDQHNIKRIPLHPVLADKHVLLVEDDEVNQFFVTKYLQAFGVQVHAVENGLKALEILKTKSFDVILMDVRMPEMDGYETTKAIRRSNKWKRLPIIALTAHALPGEREKCIEAGMDDYLTKPFDPDQLQDKLIKWVQCKTA